MCFAVRLDIKYLVVGSAPGFVILCVFVCACVCVYVCMCVRVRVRVPLVVAVMGVNVVACAV